MKRTRTAAVVAALGLTLALAGTTAARNPHAGTHGGGHGANKTHVHGHAGTKGPKNTDQTTTTENVDTLGAPIVTTIWVTGNTSHPGATFRVVALVKAPLATRPETLDAVVQFASGPATVVLVHNGNGHGVAYHGTATVPDAEPTGKVAIDVTGTVGGSDVTGTGWGAVIANDTTDENANTTEGTDGADGTDATDTQGDEADQGDDAQGDGAQGDGAQGDEDGDQGDEADADSDDGDSTDGSQPQLDPELVKQLIAYLQSLLD